MQAQATDHITPEAYLEIERATEFKSEYFDGDMFAMGGGSRSHALIALNIGSALQVQLKERPCVVYPSDLRVCITDTGLYTYPDLTVVCGEEHFLDDTSDTLLNPTVVVEVLSPSTEAYDRGTKFEHYRQLPSLQEYLLVAQHEARIEQFVRQPGDRWLLTVARGLSETLELPSIRCTLPLSEAYLKVILDGKVPLHQG